MDECLFKKRFNIATKIQYVPNLVIDSSCEKAYKRAWKKVEKGLVATGSTTRIKRFDRLLEEIERLGDDLPFCDKVEIKFINDKVGHGVFAVKRIAPYTVLNHYAGILKQDKAIPGDNDSTFTFSELPSFSIDGLVAGNWCRFMNHGPEKGPNTNVIAWEHYSKWGPRIIFTAGRKGIKKGDQLLYSYGETYWDEFSSSSLPL